MHKDAATLFTVSAGGGLWSHLVAFTGWGVASGGLRADFRLQDSPGWPHRQKVNPPKVSRSVVTSSFSFIEPRFFSHNLHLMYLTLDTINVSENRPHIFCGCRLAQILLSLRVILDLLYAKDRSWWHWLCLVPLQNKFGANQTSLRWYHMMDQHLLVWLKTPLIRNKCCPKLPRSSIVLCCSLQTIIDVALHECRLPRRPLEARLLWTVAALYLSLVFTLKLCCPGELVADSLSHVGFTKSILIFQRFHVI